MKIRSIIFLSLFYFIFSSSCSPATLIAINQEIPVNTPVIVGEEFFENDSATDRLVSSAVEQTPVDIIFPETTELDCLDWRPPLSPAPLAMNPHDHFYFLRPISVDEVNWPLANYRYGYIFPGSTAVHTGIDIDAERGSPVFAAGTGRVTWIGYGLLYGENNTSDPYGLAVVIRHNFGYEDRRLLTIYAHLDRIDVSLGQIVDESTQLGIVGNTGNSTGPHLHFEVRLETGTSFRTRNPELWIVPPEGRGVLAGHITNTNGSWLTEFTIAIQDSSSHLWNPITYAGEVVYHDDYYQENLVLGDLPAGEYRIQIDYLNDRYYQTVFILPGMITFFSFEGTNGFSLEPPAIPESFDWLITPSPEVITTP